MEKVVIPADVSGGEPEGHKEAMIAKAEQGSNFGKAPAPVADKAVDADRPAWLPEKFKTPEDFAKSYSELESKLGKSDEQTTSEKSVTNEQEAAIAADAGLDIHEMRSYANQHGDLSEDHYKALESRGIPRELVKEHIAGQMAVAAQLTAAVFNEAGGEDGYKSMIKWASTNLSEGEIGAFNRVLEGNDIEAVKLAVNGLNSKYTRAVGKQPNLLNGSVSSQSGDRFNSYHELVQAQKDPRYKANDPAYHRLVREKLARSSI